MFSLFFFYIKFIYEIFYFIFFLVFSLFLGRKGAEKYPVYQKIVFGIDFLILISVYILIECLGKVGLEGEGFSFKKQGK